MFSRNETFPVHCRPLQAPPASGVFFMISNSDSEKGWVFFLLKQESGGGCTRFNLFNVLVALYLYFHLCILLCQHEVVSPLGNPGLLGASMCLWYCICKYMFVALYLWLCICVFVFGSTRWRVLWEIQDYSGPPQGREQWSIIQQPANESICSTPILA